MKVRKLIKYLQSLPKDTEVFMLKDIEVGMGYTQIFEKMKEKDLEYNKDTNKLLIVEG